MRAAKPTGAGMPQSAEMNPGVGFRLRYGVGRPDEATISGLSQFPTPEISDLMNRLYTMEPAIRVLTDDAHTICGPACTVKVYPGDNIAVHKSLDIAKPGDVIVVDGSASSLNAVLGDLVSTKARHRGVNGFVVDGLIRDLPAIRQLANFPVFARGISPIGPMHRGPGEVNYPVCCGRIVVNPGDIIVGDLNGVVVVPKDQAVDILERLRSNAQVEAQYSAAIMRGEFSNAWVDILLDNAGVQVEYNHEEGESHKLSARPPPEPHEYSAALVIVGSKKVCLCSTVQY